MNRYPNFVQAIDAVLHDMKTSSTQVRRGKWQGVDVSRKPEMTANELCHVDMQVSLHEYGEDLDLYQRDIKPNLPWADDHFLERVCGYGLNPGVEWERWPWGKNAQKFLDERGFFDHNYMERYWPRHAGYLPIPTLTAQDFKDKFSETCTDWTNQGRVNQGIRFEWGDLNDVVEELFHDPTTRQAVLPIFFPEDTGYRPGRRKPCSLFYHFLLNRSKLDVVYYLRSCDLVRHFRDDIYLTVRLLLWMLEQLRKKRGQWRVVQPGFFVMTIGNLHCFVNDRPLLDKI